MNKKMLLSVLLIGLLMFGAGMGTFAYYSKTFTSSDNEIKAASFDLSTDQNFGVSKDFEVNNFAPGFEGKWDFYVDKSASEVAVGTYNIKITAAGNLFGTNSPIKFDLYRHDSNEGTWKKVKDDMDMNTDYPVLANHNHSYETDWFRIAYQWPYGNDDSDNAFQGATGTVNVTVKAIQAQTDQHVKFANVMVTAADGNNSTTSVRILVNDNNQIVGVEGNDTILGEIGFDNNTQQLTSSLLGDIKGENLTPNINGYYMFRNPGAYPIVEIQP